MEIVSIENYEHFIIRNLKSNKQMTLITDREQFN